MGVVILTIIILIIAIISTVICHYTERIIPAVIVFAAWMFFVTFVFADVCTLVATSEDSACYNEYWSLKMLQSSIENSDNEILRFEYFQRVEKFNAGYDEWKKDKESFWFGWVTGDKYRGCERIEFELRPGDSTGPRIEVLYD